MISSSLLIMAMCTQQKYYSGIWQHGGRKILRVYKYSTKPLSSKKIVATSVGDLNSLQSQSESPVLLLLTAWLQKNKIFRAVEKLQI